MKDLDIYYYQYLICMRIRSYIYENNINIMKMAEDINISYEYLRHLLSYNGKKNISLRRIITICEYLDINLDELFDKI